MQAYLARRGGAPEIAIVIFGEETEEICRELGCTLILPPNSLGHRLDSKIVTTQLGAEAGDAPSVPNVLGRAPDLGRAPGALGERGLGANLVVQTP